MTPPRVDSWLRLAFDPVGFAHESWLGPEALATRSLDVGQPARQQANQILVAQWELPRLSSDDVQLPGAGLAVLTESAVGSILIANALVLSDTKRAPTQELNREQAQTVGELAQQLRDVKLSIRPLLIATQDPVERYRCATAAVRARFHRATQALTPALAKRWLYRFASGQSPHTSPVRRSDDTLWMAQCEAVLLNHFGSWEQAPCL